MDVKCYLDLHHIQGNALEKGYAGVFLRFYGVNYFDFALNGKLSELLREMLVESIRYSLSVKNLYYLGKGDFYLMINVTNCLEKLTEQLQLVLRKVSDELCHTSYWCVLYQEQGLHLSIARQVLASTLTIEKDLALPLLITHLTPGILLDFEMSMEHLFNFPKAIACNEIVFDYQPIFDIKLGNIKSLEALARWRFDGREIKPDEFIPVLQSSQYARAFDLHLVRSICQSANSLKTRYGDVSISMNLAGEALADNNFIELMLAELTQAGINNSSIIIEITELSPVTVGSRCWHNLAELKKAGIKLALDDFGQGYSCFSNLRNLPIDILKIDRVLTAGIMTNAGDLELLRLILDYCSHHNLIVVIEGVETAEQHNMLKQLGANLAQGFYYGRPQKIDSFQTKATVVNGED
ncbi:EAL domain-containing protein [Alteromonas sp. CYL-A6]|uniref:EAL domain-containing protein n=1 Tax=Alteromonas nitratireducens TaxID=3390813 RepID=UPI0034C3CE85